LKLIDSHNYIASFGQGRAAGDGTTDAGVTSLACAPLVEAGLQADGPPRVLPSWATLNRMLRASPPLNVSLPYLRLALAYAARTGP
jgi:hypothetical protein